LYNVLTGNENPRAVARAPQPWGAKLVTVALPSPSASASAARPSWSTARRAAILNHVRRLRRSWRLPCQFANAVAHQRQPAINVWEACRSQHRPRCALAHARRTEADL